MQFAFFQDKRVRALRRKYGDLAMIIYQKMMLKSLEENCTMKYEGLEDTFEEEIAVDIVEDELEKVLLIKQVMDFLIKHELMIEQKDGCFFFPQAAKMSGSESDSAERMRKKRERDKKKQSSQSDGNMSQATVAGDESMSHCEVIRTEQETDLHLNLDKSKSLDVKSKTNTEQADADAVSADQPAGAAAADTAAPQAGDLFSVNQLLATAEKNKVNLTKEGILAFHEEMQETQWILYQKPIEKRSIIRALRAWAKYHPEFSQDQEDEINLKNTGGKEQVQKRVVEKLIECIPKKLRSTKPILEWGSYITEYCSADIFTDDEMEFIEDKYKIKIG